MSRMASIYNINNTEKCGMFPVEDIDYENSRQIDILKQIANRIILGADFQTQLNYVILKLKEHGKLPTAVSEKQVGTRLRRLIYKADIDNQFTHLYRNNYRVWKLKSESLKNKWIGTYVKKRKIQGAVSVLPKKRKIQETTVENSYIEKLRSASMNAIAHVSYQFYDTTLCEYKEQSFKIPRIGVVKMPNEFEVKMPIELDESPFRDPAHGNLMLPLSPLPNYLGDYVPSDIVMPPFRTDSPPI